MNGVVPRQYTYSFRTGVVTTDNERLANVLYNINQIDAKLTQSFEDAAGDAFFLLIDAKINLEDFVRENGLTSQSAVVENALDKAAEAVKNADTLADLESMYLMLLETVPVLRNLSDEADGEN